MHSGEKSSFIVTLLGYSDFLDNRYIYTQVASVDIVVLTRTNLSWVLFRDTIDHTTLNFVQLGKQIGDEFVSQFAQCLRRPRSIQIVLAMINKCMHVCKYVVCYCWLVMWCFHNYALNTATYHDICMAMQLCVIVHMLATFSFSVTSYNIIVNDLIIYLQCMLPHAMTQT